MAAGHGRHARLLAARGLRVEAIDRDPQALAALAGIDGVTPVAADIESGPWPCAGHTFGAVVVTNYLWRARLADIAAAVGAGGILVYETFAVGNETLGKPSNPLFLLRRGELLDLARAAGLMVLGFESGRVESPRPAVIERICAWRARAADLPPGIG